MKQRRRFWTALVSLALQFLTPVAAYAAMKAAPDFSRLCSVSGKTGPSANVPAGTPFPSTDAHSATHCALCLGETTTTALLPPASALPLLVTSGVFATSLPAIASTAPPRLFPPSRGPPAALPAV